MSCGAKRERTACPRVPTTTGHAFLDLPHPKKIDPVAAFMKYVRGERDSLHIGSTTTISIELGGIPGGALCLEITESKDTPWSDDDVRSIVRRLVEWWDADKGNLKRMDVAWTVSTHL